MTNKPRRRSSLNRVILKEALVIAARPRTLASMTIALLIAFAGVTPGAAQLPPGEGPIEPPFQPGDFPVPGFDPDGPGFQPGPEDFPTGPDIDRVYTEKVVVTFDILPIAVVYSPPGQASDVLQALAVTERFGTSVTVSQANIDGKPTSFPEPAKYGFSLKLEEEEEWSRTTSDGTTHVFFIETTWRSWTGATDVGPEQPFPGDGDTIVFFRDAKFLLKLQTGEINDGMPRFFDPPRILAMEPVELPWNLRATTVWDLRRESGGDYEPSVVQRLLTLDPFAGTERGPSRSLGPGVRMTPSSGESVSDPHLSEPRYKLQTIVPNQPDEPMPIGWDPCGDSDLVGATLVQGDYTSTTITHRHTARTAITGFGESSFTFEYSRNEMTEHERTTDATARFGGGELCGDEGGPFYWTEIWYDSAFGTLAFPTTETPPANTFGSAITSGNSGAGGRTIIVTAEDGQRYQTRADAHGRFKLHLGPGRYTIGAADDRARIESQEITFEVPDDPGEVIRLSPLRLGQPDAQPEREIAPTPTTGPRTLPGVVEPPTPTPTPRERGLPDDIRLPTATSTPGRSGPVLTGPR